MNQEKEKVAALPTIRRLPVYLRLLKELKSKGNLLVSGTYLAEKMGCEPIQVRKDLAATGTEGRPRLGFEIEKTIEAIEDFLGWNNTQDAFIIGIGSLGSALLGYKTFEHHNISIVAAFDNDPEKIGSIVHGKEIFDISKLAPLASRMHIQIGILTVPEFAAQMAAEYLVNSGIKGIWNFSPANLAVPADIVVQNEDLSSGLAVLCKRIKAKAEVNSERC